MRRVVLAVLTMVAIGATALPSSAGAPGKWEKLAGDVGSSLYLPGVVRTGDKVLHVVWGKDVSPSSDQYFHAAITKAGAIGATTNVLASGWAALNAEPKVVRNGGGIRILFSGLNGGGTGYFYQATSGNGASWSTPGQVSQWQYAYGAYGLGADTFADGTPIVGGPLNSDIYWHRGTNAAQADGHVTVGGASIIRLNVAVDRVSDEAWAVWYDLTNGGVWSRRIEPTVTAAKKAPSSTPGGSSLVPGQQLPLVARPGGGLYTAYCTAYPSCSKAVVWQVGTKRTIPIKVSSATDVIALGSGGAGRLWVVTHDNYSGMFYATRSNKKVTKFGAIRKIKPPAKSLDAYGVAVEGGTGRSDLVANVLDTGSRDNLWHTQVLPGLSLATSTKKWDGDFTKTVVFTVRDAGAAVPGATVKVGTRVCKTGVKGTCSVKFPKLGPQRLKAIASKAGYAKAVVTLRVLA
jgi:hypothetical protein